jgi:hypothetical protein
MTGTFRDPEDCAIWHVCQGPNPLDLISNDYSCFYVTAATHLFNFLLPQSRFAWVDVDCMSVA